MDSIGIRALGLAVFFCFFPCVSSAQGIAPVDNAVSSLSASGVKAGPWSIGRVHPVEEGSNRLLLFTMHGVRENFDVTPSYGGQTMVLIQRRMVVEGTRVTSIRVYALWESEIRKAVDNNFRLNGFSGTVRWARRRAYASVFLSNVDQVKTFGHMDTGTSKRGTVARCSKPPHVSERSVVVAAATAAKPGTFALAGFQGTRELYLGRTGDGVVGTRPGRGSDDSIRVEHTRPGSLALACLEIRAPAGPHTFTAVTFNTGAGNLNGQPGYLSERYYGNGLAWLPAVDEVASLLQQLQADVIGFQEIFHSPECGKIPLEARRGFVCEGWNAGDPTVAQTILGDGYQIACHLGKNDKCLAVKRSFASIRGCAGDLCLNALDGKEISGCGSGSRVGRAVLDLVGGGELTVVNVHASSSLSGRDQRCRKKQFRSVFENLDGQAAANGRSNLVLGDFNTDPGRLQTFDNSARRLAKLMVDQGFDFISEVGFAATPTHRDLWSIDHVISDAFAGRCEYPRVASETLDHLPVVCVLTGPH